MSATYRTPLTALDVVRTAGATLAVAIAVAALLQLVCLVRATNVLQQAAQAGTHEATLPGATYETVQAATRRALAGSQLASAACYLEVHVAGQHDLLRPLESATRGDTIQVRLSLPSEAAVPNLLGWCGWPPTGRLLGQGGARL